MGRRHKVGDGRPPRTAQVNNWLEAIPAPSEGSAHSADSASASDEDSYDGRAGVSEPSKAGMQILDKVIRNYGDSSKNPLPQELQDACFAQLSLRDMVERRGTSKKWQEGIDRILLSRAFQDLEKADPPENTVLAELATLCPPLAWHLFARIADSAMEDIPPVELYGEGKRCVRRRSALAWALAVMVGRVLERESQSLQLEADSLVRKGRREARRLLYGDLPVLPTTAIRASAFLGLRGRAEFWQHYEGKHYGGDDPGPPDIDALAELLEAAQDLHTARMMQRLLGHTTAGGERVDVCLDLIERLSESSPFVAGDHRTPRPWLHAFPTFLDNTNYVEPSELVRRIGERLPDAPHMLDVLLTMRHPMFLEAGLEAGVREALAADTDVAANIRTALRERLRSSRLYTDPVGAASDYEALGVDAEEHLEKLQDLEDRVEAAANWRDRPRHPKRRLALKVAAAVGSGLAAVATALTLVVIPALGFGLFFALLFITAGWAVGGVAGTAWAWDERQGQTKETVSEAWRDLRPGQPAPESKVLALAQLNDERVSCEYRIGALERMARMAQRDVDQLDNQEPFELFKTLQDVLWAEAS